MEKLLVLIVLKALETVITIDDPEVMEQFNSVFKLVIAIQLRLETIVGLTAFVHVFGKVKTIFPAGNTLFKGDTVTVIVPDVLVVLG